MWGWPGLEGGGSIHGDWGRRGFCHIAQCLASRVQHPRSGIRSTPDAEPPHQSSTGTVCAKRSVLLPSGGHGPHCPLDLPLACVGPPDAPLLAPGSPQPTRPPGSSPGSFWIFRIFPRFPLDLPPVPPGSSPGSFWIFPRFLLDLRLVPSGSSPGSFWAAINGTRESEQPPRRRCLRQ